MPIVTKTRALYSVPMKRWLAIIIISLLLVFFIYPSAFIYSKDTLPDNNDTRLIAYIIGQVQQNIVKHQPLYYGTFFAPDKDTLTYSDAFITSATLSLPLQFVTHSPIQVFNVILIFGFLLTIITSFLLFDYLFKDIWVSLLSTAIFNFSGYHLSYLPHIQIFLLWPLLLAIYFFIRFQKEQKPIFLSLFFLATTLQMAESFFPVYLIFFTIVILYVFERPSKNQIIRDIKTAIPRIIPFTIIWYLLLSPYIKLHNSLPEATRPIRDAAHFSLGLDSIFTFYHSWTVIIITSICLFILIRKTLKKTSSPKISNSILPWLTTFVFSLLMTLGPVLKIFGKNLRVAGFPIPLPYTLFYYLFPGFTGFRTPSRFIILAVLAAAVFVGFTIKPFLSSLKFKSKLLLVSLFVSLLFIEADLPLKGFPVNINMHPVYEQVRELPKDAIILELPIKLWNTQDHEIESIRSLYSLEHGHRRFNGFSGFATNSWIDLVHRIDSYGLNPDTVARLRALGITHVIENNILRPL